MGREHLYAAYFASYLTALAAAGSLAGTATAAMVMTIRRTEHPKQLRLLLTTATAMIVLHDTDGVGLALTLLLPVRRANQATAVTHPE